MHRRRRVSSIRLEMLVYSQSTPVAGARIWYSVKIWHLVLALRLVLSRIIPGRGRGFVMVRLVIVIENIAEAIFRGMGLSRVCDLRRNCSMAVRSFLVRLPPGLAVRFGIRSVHRPLWACWGITSVIWAIIASNWTRLLPICLYRRLWSADWLLSNCARHGLTSLIH